MDGKIIYDVELDCIGLYCPMPIAKTKETMDAMKGGSILKIEADDPAAEEDIKAWAKRTGQHILNIEKNGIIVTIYIKKMK